MKPSRNCRKRLLPAAAAGLGLVLTWRAAQVVGGWTAFAAERPAAAPTAAMQPTAGAAHPSTGPVATAQSAPELAACVPALGSPGQEGNQPDADLVAEVAHRTAALDRRERSLSLREAQLTAASQLASRQMADLERMRQTVEALVVRESKASAVDMTLLVGLYSHMKPVQAGTVLGKLDAQKAAEILQNLPTSLAGPILAAMDPGAAVKVTEELEQRHAAFRQ